LTDLLGAKTSLLIREIEDKDMLVNGCIFLAPGDYHLLFEKDGSLSLDDSEKVAFSRPSIDVAFQSAADAYGAATICLLLSGANADGAAGMAQVQAAGGITVAQSPESAEVPYMPQQAIDRQVADYVLDVQGIVEFLNRI
jgi:two-component system chemotaxis response regulator CheB